MALACFNDCISLASVSDCGFSLELLFELTTEEEVEPELKELLLLLLLLFEDAAAAAEEVNFDDNFEDKELTIEEPVFVVILEPVF